MLNWTHDRFLNGKDHQYRLKRLIIIAIIAAVGFVFVILLSEWSEKKALAQAQQRAHDVLIYQSANVVSHLNNFSIITALMSKRPDVIRLFRERETGTLTVDAQQLASTTTGLTGAKDFWFIDKAGLIFSSSNPDIVGVNVSNKNYFEAGFQGRLGRASEVDKTGLRSYVFASPVFFDGSVIGLVAVRVNLELVEEVWALLVAPILATEMNDRILLSNIYDWRLRSFTSIIKPRNTRSKSYNVEKNYSTPLHKTPSAYESQSVTVPILGAEHLPKGTLTPNHFSFQQTQLLELKNTEPLKNTSYLVVSTDVPLLQWRLHVLVDLAPVKQQGLITAVISSLLVVLIMLLIWVLFERRRRLIDRVRHQRAFALRLERQVRDRTHELTATNAMLKTEVIERRAAEDALRETQQDLMQAAKLAGIGQMSAALAHEYNQPLAAIRSYADNAMQLLVREDSSAAQDNLRRITSITERMASLTKTLRSFAHKPESTAEPVILSSVMDEMIILLSPQAKAMGVQLVVNSPKKEVTVLAGHLRLSQVIINLVSNAMDAAKANQSVPSQWVDVSWCQQGSDVHIIVKDSGEGIPQEIRDKISTPFFTTKGVGVGLGLGLFIVYTMIKEFQGEIELIQKDGSGAEFHIVLPVARP